MIRRGEDGGAAFIALMVARVAYFSFQDGELVQCSICKKRQDKVQRTLLQDELSSRAVQAVFHPSISF